MTRVPLREAADSLAKASVHEPVGRPGGPGLWKHKGLQLPAYIQHIANDLKSKFGDTSRAIATAIAIVKHPPKNWGPEARAAAAKAAAEWEALKASHGGVKESAVAYSIADEIAVREAALTRLALFSPAGLVDVLAEGMLTESAEVVALAEALRFDLLTVAHLDIPPLRRVQEARRVHPFDLVAEDFDPNELRGFGGKWIKGGARINNLLAARPSTSRVRGAADQRYEGGVARDSAKLRAAHAAKPQIALEQLAGSVGSGRWDAGAKRTTGDLLAGKVKDTETAHRMGPHGSYSKERQALHERIVSNLLQGKGTHANPEAIFTAGGPASGKSSLEEHGHLVTPKDVVHANPDVVREMLPEYQQLKAAGREDAADLTHEEASHLAKVVTRVAFARRHHLLVDSVGDSGPGKFAGKINAAKAAGYRTSVHYATTSTEEAIRRADKRGQQTGRFVDHGTIRQAHTAASQRFPDVEKISGIHVRVFDTSGSAPRLIAERKRGSDNLRIVDGEAFGAFRAKAKG